MALKPCPGCKEPIDWNSRKCVKCGRPDPFRWRAKVKLITFGILIGVPIVLYVGFMLVGAILGWNHAEP